MGSYHRWYGEFSDYGDAENYIADRKRNIEGVSANNKIDKE